MLKTQHYELHAALLELTKMLYEQEIEGAWRYAVHAGLAAVCLPLKCR